MTDNKCHSELCEESHRKRMAEKGKLKAEKENSFSNANDLNISELTGLKSFP